MSPLRRCAQRIGPITYCFWVIMVIGSASTGNDTILQYIIQNQHELQTILMENRHNEEFIDGLTLGSVDNSYDGEYIDIGQTRFNTLFWFSGFNIIKRECLACEDIYKVIYYRRFTQLSSFDVYGLMKEWTSTDNLLGTDFGLYSTLQDALSDSNRWQWCNYDSDNVGAFLDCGPDLSSRLLCQFTADLSTWDEARKYYQGECVKPAKFSIYVRALAVSILQQNDALADTQASILENQESMGSLLITATDKGDEIFETLVAADKVNDAMFMQMMQPQNRDFIEVLTLGSVDNSYYGQSIDVEQTPFNTMFRFSRFNIIKRECLACEDDYKVIYYRRFTQLSSFDVYGLMKEWTSTDNLLGTDFGLYSTLQGALSDMNCWQSCHYDLENVGAFFDCAQEPDNVAHCQYTADMSTWDAQWWDEERVNGPCVKPTKFSIYVGDGNIGNTVHGKNEMVEVSRYRSGVQNDYMMVTSQNAASFHYAGNTDYYAQPGVLFKLLRSYEPHTVPLFRKYSVACYCDHMVTTVENETEGVYVMDRLLGFCYQNQWVQDNLIPIRRLYDTVDVDHVTAVDEDDIDNLKEQRYNLDWGTDGILCYAYAATYNADSSSVVPAMPVLPVIGRIANDGKAAKPKDDDGDDYVVIKIGMKELYVLGMSVAVFLGVFSFMCAMLISKRSIGDHKYNVVKYMDSETELDPQ
eukprot:244916_1